MKNPSFEKPYSIREAQQVSVAEGWEPFYLDNVPPPTGGGNPQPVYRPEYKELPRSLDAARVIDGDSAQAWFKLKANIDAGVYQRVAVPAGATCTFSAHVQAWCSNSDDPRVSDGEMYFKVGIDPSGETDAYSEQVVWDDDWYLVRGEYVKRSIAVVAGAAHITVFVRAWNKWAMKHNDCYLDKCSLTITGGEPAPPVPPPPGGEFDWERLAQAHEAFAAVLRDAS